LCNEAPDAFSETSAHSKLQEGCWNNLGYYHDSSGLISEANSAFSDVQFQAPASCPVLEDYSNLSSQKLNKNTSQKLSSTVVKQEKSAAAIHKKHSQKYMKSNFLFIAQNLHTNK